MSEKSNLDIMKEAYAAFEVFIVLPEVDQVRAHGDALVGDAEGHLLRRQGGLPGARDQVLLQPGLQSLGEACGQIEGPAFTRKLHYVAGSIEDGAAVPATFEVLFQALAQGGADVVFDVVGNLAPHVLALQLRGHGSAPGIICPPNPKAIANALGL